jgi:hypothetical protein
MPRSYEDVRGLLEASRIEGLIGQGASQELIDAAEVDLAVSIPSSYKAFLREYGWGYFGSLGVICGLGDDIPVEWSAGIDLRRVVSDERKGELRVPNHVVPFYSSGAGDWYAFDCSSLKSGEATVVFIPHEVIAQKGFYFDDLAVSFPEWIYASLNGD